MTVGPGNSSFPPMVSTNFSIFCSCAAEIGPASSAAAYVLPSTSLGRRQPATFSCKLSFNSTSQSYCVGRIASTPIWLVTQRASSQGGVSVCGLTILLPDYGDAAAARLIHHQIVGNLSSQSIVKVPGPHEGSFQRCRRRARPSSENGAPLLFDDVAVEAGLPPGAKCSETAAYASGRGCDSSHNERAISTGSIPSWPHQAASLPLR